MTAAALLLATAVLLGVGPNSARRRAGVVGARHSVSGRRRSRTDPFAIASAYDVLAVCLSTGMAVSAAAAATAPCAPPALGAVLRRAAELLALGADPDTAWQPRAGDTADGCESLTRLARRSASSGSALAEGITDLAEQSRQDAAHAAAAAAERAGVLIAGPLGLCFLPAFVCLGIAPVVAGLAGEIFGSGLL
ncbi:MAG: type II secretion system F family protein [Mycobacterium sp.]